MKSRFARVLKDETGSSTVEFVIVFLGVISMMMFVIEMAIYQFSVASLEKAAEAGVRYAAVSSPAATGVELTNDRENNGVDYGRSCASGACEAFSAPPCRGASMAGCRAAQLDAIIAVMHRFNGAIERKNVTVTYTDTGIGFAGGPSAPMVTVSISGMPYPTGVMRLLVPRSLPAGMGTLPTRAASMTAEDMAS